MFNESRISIRTFASPLHCHRKILVRLLLVRSEFLVLDLKDVWIINSKFICIRTIFTK